MLSAFGIEHTGVSKARDRKKGAKTGAAIGGVAGSALSVEAARRGFRDIKRDAAYAPFKTWKPRNKAGFLAGMGTAAGGLIIAPAVGIGAGAGAAIGRKKVAKSLVNGEFVRAIDMTAEQRKTVGGYKKLAGRSAEHSTYMRQRQRRINEIDAVKGQTHNIKYGALGSKEGLKNRLTGKGGSWRGYALRRGSAKGGSSHFFGFSGPKKKEMGGLRAHEEAHGMEGRNEYRLHHQIMRDPVKRLSEEARADMAPGAHGHFGEQYLKTYGSKKHGIAGGQPNAMSGYASAALHKDPKRLQHIYPDLNDEQAKKGLDAYVGTQNKILAARGGKEKAIAHIQANPYQAPKKFGVAPRNLGEDLKRPFQALGQRRPRRAGQLQPLPASRS